MQPDTAADGDSSINTKKGFLISLPSRKKKNTDEPGSGIVMAKNDAAKGDRGEKGDRRPPKPSFATARGTASENIRATLQRDNGKNGEKEKNADRTQSVRRAATNRRKAAEKTKTPIPTVPNARSARNAPVLRKTRSATARITGTTGTTAKTAIITAIVRRAIMTAPRRIRKTANRVRMRKMNVPKTHPKTIISRIPKTIAARAKIKTTARTQIRTKTRKAPSRIPAAATAVCPKCRVFRRFRAI